jgi:sterol desaturase/sphingolipid hydroxylase (fatty acid hydroxylase superfamily)
MTSLQRWAGAALYPAVVAASLGLWAGAWQAGLPLAWAVMTASVLALALAAVLSRRWPYQPAWQKPQGDVSTDITSAAVLVGLADPLLHAGLTLLPIVALQWAPASTHWWPASSPLALQIGLALGWIELAKYASHRWHHQQPALWWLHAMHHGSQRLYWLNGLRFHPLNHAINTALALGPLWWLGVPNEVLMATAAITQPVAMLQHANLAWPCGWANQVFSTYEMHRLHHSRHPQQANSNYGSALLLWDRLLGTWRAPAPLRAQDVGLFKTPQNGPAYPALASYWRQLSSLLRPVCCPNCCNA